MQSKDIRVIRAALDVVRESETAISRLSISIIAFSSRETLDGTKDFLSGIKKNLLFQLVMALLGLSDATIRVLRDLWLKITKVSYLS